VRIWRVDGVLKIDIAMDPKTLTPFSYTTKIIKTKSGKHQKPLKLKSLNNMHCKLPG